MNTAAIGPAAALEHLLEQATVGWTEPVIVQEFPVTEQGEADLRVRADVLAAHGYALTARRVSRQSTWIGAADISQKATFELGGRRPNPDDPYLRRRFLWGGSGLGAFKPGGPMTLKLMVLAAVVPLVLVVLLWIFAQGS